MGSAIGMKVMEGVPYIKGLKRFFKNGLEDNAKDYLNDMGAAAAYNGAVGLFHVEGLTPEAVRLKTSLQKESVKSYIIDEEEMERVKDSYSCIWKNPEAKPKLCFIGCPHLSMNQLKKWARIISCELKLQKRERILIPTVLTASVPVIKEFRQTEEYQQLLETGVRLSYICPLMYMNNPKCQTVPVITNSNKLRTYTSSRYYTDEEILRYITRGENK